ncbi:hypothetical protein GPJ56_003764 [Histomonas meleagridis]|uniref:uncharacterized protein n=1 Tax=Histomonas meleagridis TaxID=135588 RepID=UPI00355A24B9|nr:hypothetical protein GPJ56_003764 [Histomonas meleagridis]KAH0805222.1 hypothetical protein GO595_002167 [Histomonas meleagridis]
MESSNDLLENIGKKVLDNWGNDEDVVPDIFMENQVVNEINKIINTPYEELPVDYKVRLKKLIGAMTPVDFAVIGKQICLFLLSDITDSDTTKNDKSTNQSSTCSSDFPTYEPLNSTPPTSLSLSNDIDISYTQFPQWLPTLTF